MIAIMTGRPLRFPGTILVLAVTSATFASPTLAASETQEPDPYSQILEQIETAEAQGGPNAPELIEPLTALGQFHQERGEQQTAFAALARARGVLRVNHGFSTLQEVLLLRQMTASLHSGGDVAGAWQFEQNMLRLAQNHVGDIGTLSVFRDVIARRSEVLSRYRSGEFPDEMVLGCYYSGAPHIRNMTADSSMMAATAGQSSCSAGSRRAALASMMREIQHYQALAIEALLSNDLHYSDELQQLIFDVIRNSEELQSVQPYGDRAVGRILNRVFVDVPGDTASMLSLTTLYVHVADFNLRRMHRTRRYSDYEHIRNQYALALARLEQLGVAQAAIDEIFSPAVPVMLPAFEPTVLVAVADDHPSGDFIDVAFDVTRYGNAERVQILDNTGTAPRAEARNVIRLIERSSFRPLMVDGQLPDRTRVFARYVINPTHFDDAL
jgi:hypothetical protein